MENIIFISSPKTKQYLHFQCSNNMTIEDIQRDIRKYIYDHKDELYIDRTEIPIYFKRYTLIKDDTLWDKY